MKLLLNGVSVNYEIKGKGQAVLLVHGWGGSLKSLEALADLLSEKYKTIRLDLPGFGASDNPDKDWGMVEYSVILLKIIDNLKVRPVVYFGHSFGGALGIYLAANSPTYIKKLIISGASYQRKKLPSSKISSLFKWLPTPLKMLIYKVLYPDSDLYRIPKLETNFRKIMTQDLTPLLTKINQPALILWGKDDRQTPVKLAKEAKLKIKNSRLKIYPDTGHSLPLKHPQKVYAEIQKFI